MTPKKKLKNLQFPAGRRQISVSVFPYAFRTKRPPIGKLIKIGSKGIFGVEDIKKISRGGYGGKFSAEGVGCGVVDANSKRK